MEYQMIDNNRQNDFENAFAALMQNEGGFSNDPMDTGGKTIYGITERDYPQTFKIVYTLFKQGKQQIAYNIAKRFYYKMYWNPLYEEIPDSSLAFKIFDLSVNKGKEKTIKLLQRILKYDFGKTIAVDGQFGQITLGAVKSVDNHLLYQKFIEYNESDYRNMKTFWKFGKGWLRRLFRRIYV